MLAHSSYSDQQLLDCLKSGDRIAFAEIYDRYWSLMYVHVFKMLRNEDEAKDLVQDLFAALWIKGANIPHNTNLSGYLYVSVRNKVINFIQQKKFRQDYLNSQISFVEETTNTTLEQISEKELMGIVEGEIQNLPQKMRRIFELSRKQYLSHKEIASLLDISDKTVKKQIGYAIKVIKLRLDILTKIIIILFFLYQ